MQNEKNPPEKGFGLKKDDAIIKTLKLAHTHKTQLLRYIGIIAVW